MKARAVGCALAAITTAAVIAGSAMAISLGDAGGISYRLQSKHAAAGNTADAKAPCPKGKSVVGGGFQAFADQGLSEYQSAVSKPFDGADAGHQPDDGWEDRAQVPDNGFNATAVAICAKGSYRYVSNHHPAFGPSRVKVECPSGLHVTGGGGSLGKPASSTLIASFPIDGDDRDAKPDDGWEAWGQSTLDDKIRVFAVCARKKPAYHESTDSLDPGSGSRGLAMCGKHQHLLGVGGKIGDAPSTTARTQLAEPNDFDNNRVYDDSGASFNENDNTAPLAVDATTFAICTR